MAPVRRKRLVRARMEDVMVLDLEAWHRIGKKQKEDEKEIERLKDEWNENQQQIGFLRSMVDDRDKKNADLLIDKQNLKDDVVMLGAQLKDLEERLKFESRRVADALSAFDNVASAADSSALVAVKMVRLLDELGLEFVPRSKREEKKR